VGVDIARNACEKLQFPAKISRVGDQKAQMSRRLFSGAVAIEILIP
jgi:hypothetical protein